MNNSDYIKNTVWNNFNQGYLEENWWIIYLNEKIINKKWIIILKK